MLLLKTTPLPGEKKIKSPTCLNFRPTWRFVSTRLSGAARKSGCGFKWSGASCMNRAPNVAHMCALSRRLPRLDKPTSAPSPKSLGLRRRSVGCFSRRERSAAIWIIAVERATRKNSQPAAAHRVALKMGRPRAQKSFLSPSSPVKSSSILLPFSKTLPDS